MKRVGVEGGWGEFSAASYVPALYINGVVDGAEGLAKQSRKGTPRSREHAKNRICNEPFHGHTGRPLKKLRALGGRTHGGARTQKIIIP